MKTLGHVLSSLVFSFLSFVLMIVLSIISFFFTVFVVDFGASLAGYPGNQYTVLSAALLVASAILAGGLSPAGFLNAPGPDDTIPPSREKRDT